MATANVARAAGQIRFARPTEQLSAVVRFYVEGLGLERIAGFEDDAGYSGVILGLPGRELQLEFLSHADGSDGRAPSGGEPARLYLGDGAERDRRPLASARSEAGRYRPRIRSGTASARSRSRTPTAGAWCSCRVPGPRGLARLAHPEVEASSRPGTLEGSMSSA